MIMQRMSFDELHVRIIQWSRDRQIIPNSTANAQFLKAVSEMGELADGLAKKDIALTADAVGDVMVCLINFCSLANLDIVECLEGAYHQIKDRKGFLMPNGVFIKDVA
jgi:NTP pyrophosphatase (non-canonical NTP hydrolase)